MSKKNKVSSSKKGNKKVVKKKLSKKTAPKKATKAKSASKPKAKVKATAKKVSGKTVKAGSSKAITTHKLKPLPVAGKKPAEKKFKESKLSDKPHYKGGYSSILSKKNSGTIPEYKPTIEPTKKTVIKSKDNFASTMKDGIVPSILSSTIKRTDSYSIKPEKEPPGKFELEFVMRTSAELLYEFLTSPSGLSEWFCDDVNIRNGIYTFIWDGQLQQARLLKTVEEQLVRYQWVDKTDGSYFEFRIQKDELTSDISLIITDFANDRGEQESAKLLWGSQIDKLMHVLGSYF